MRPYAQRNARVAFIFDTAILLLLLAAGVSVMWTLSQPFHVFRLLIGLVMGTGGLLVLWGTFIEPRRIVIRRHTADLSHHKKIRIAVISDFHVGIYNSASFIRKIVAKANTLNADVICLVGDFIDDEQSDLSALTPLRDLKAHYGVFAVTGNHDAGAYLQHMTQKPYFMQDRTADVQKLLASLGITFLRNAAKTVMINNEALVIAGTDDSFMPTCDPAKALEGIDTDTPVVLLSHTPDIILNPASHRANLIFSGHTHGGQIRLPLIGSLYPIPDKIGRAYQRGFFPIAENCTLVISGGVGVTGVRARLFCPPEILLIET